MNKVVAGICLFLVVFAVLGALNPNHCFASNATHEGPEGIDFPRELESYHDADQGILGRLTGRIQAEPFNLVGTVIFLLAICHTFLSGSLREHSLRLAHAHEQKIADGTAPLNSVSHGARVLHFLSEIEVVFGLWAIPLLISVFFFFDWPTVVGYVSHSVDYTEAGFVVVIMALASTRPILKLSEAAMSRIARLFGGSLTAWWMTILTFGPLLSSLITEPAAMTICAMLLVQKFYRLDPSPGLKYATLGLLFVNVSVGGTLTHFAAPPVLMVAGPWGWGTSHMALNFGWKAAVGIVIANSLYWYLFRKDFAALREKFEAQVLEEEVLTTHLPREAGERAIDAIVAEVEAGKGAAGPEIAATVDRYVAKVRQRSWESVQEKTAELGLDPEILSRAFEQRFEQIKLYRLQREFPHLLPRDQRAPFKDPAWDQREEPVPVWVMLVHILFMGWTIANAHHPALFVPGLLFFLGFAAVTADYQNVVDLKAPLLVGFFLGGLVTHGGVQGWWIEPVLGGLAELPLALAATVLTAFNDNSAITFLSTLVPGFTDGLKYAVVAGAVTGGGLTVIANAPNPAGQSILKEYFENGITPAGLFKAALIPTAIMFCMFMLFR